MVMRHLCTLGVKYLSRCSALVVVAMLLYMATRLLRPMVSNGHFAEFILCTNSSLTQWDQAVPERITGLLSAVLILPLFEEYIFRKWLLTWLMKKIHWFYAVVVSSTLFSAGHVQYIFYYFDFGNLLAIWAAGIVYSIVYLRRNSVFDAYISHASLNALILIPKEDIFGVHCVHVEPLAACALATVSMVGLVVLLRKIPKHSLKIHDKNQ